MSYAHVQGTTHTGQSGDNPTATFSVAVTSGNVVTGAVGWVGHVGAANLQSVTDDKGNAYTVVGTHRGLDGGGGANYHWGIFYSTAAITNGPTTITATINDGGTSPTFGAVMIDEWSGFGGAYTQIGAEGQAQATGATNSVTITANASSLVIGYFVDIGSSGVAADLTQAQNVISTFLSEWTAASGATQTVAPTLTNSADPSVLFALALGPGATNHVQGAHLAGQTGDTPHATFGSAVGSGNIVTGAVGWTGAASGSATLSSVTDDQSNSYTVVGTVYQLAGGTDNYYWATFYSTSEITNGPTTITATISDAGTSPTFGFIVVDEWSGFSGTLSSPGSGHATLTSGAGLLSASITSSSTAQCFGYGVNISSGGIEVGQQPIQLILSGGPNPQNGTWLSEWAAGTGTTQTLSTYVEEGGGGAGSFWAFSLEGTNATGSLSETIADLTLSGASVALAQGALSATISDLTLTGEASGGSASAALDTTIANLTLSGAGELPAGTTFYVANSGSDAHDGLSPATAWQTLGHVNAQGYSAGDTVLFHGGDTFTGGLVLTTANYSTNPPTSGNPLTIGSYGTGQATFTPTSSDGVSLTDIGNIVIGNLILTGDGSANYNGVNLVQTGTGVSNITLSGLTISGFGRCGIFDTGPATAGAVSNILIENCTITNCTTHVTISSNITAGIALGPGESLGDRGQSGGTWTANQVFTNVTVKNTTVGNCPGYASSPSLFQSGTGIIYSNCGSSLIDTCYVHDCGASDVQGNAGIEFNQCHNSTMRFCEVYNQQQDSAPSDGDGFDFDFGCQNCLMEYCYAHECQGAGTLLYNFGGYTWSNNTVRYCIFENNAADHLNEISIGNDGSGTQTGAIIHNNTIFATNANAISGIGGTWGGHIINNIIYGTNVSGTSVLYNNQSGAVVDGNLYYNNLGILGWAWNGTSYSTFAAYKNASSQDAHGISGSDPHLKDPGNGGTVGGYAPPAPTAYDLLRNSPAIGAGVDMQSAYSIDPGTRDFYGNGIPNGRGFNIGAFGADPAAGAVGQRLRYGIYLGVN